MHSIVRADWNSSGLRSATNRTAINALNGLHTGRVSASYWRIGCCVSLFPFHNQKRVLGALVRNPKKAQTPRYRHFSRGNHAETSGILCFALMHNSLFAVTRISHSPASWQESQFTSKPLTAASAQGPMEIKALPSLA
jgi:hypothetical protein